MIRSSDQATETVVATLDDEIRICAPGNVKGWRTSPTTARLTWDEPYSTCPICPDAIGYEVSEAAITTKSLTRPPCEITGLNPGTEYVFQVTAIANALNVSTPSLYRLPVMPAPSQPGTPQLRLERCLRDVVLVAFCPPLERNQLPGLFERVAR